MLTGEIGDAYKYVRLDTFFDEWIARIYNLIRLVIELTVWNQNLTKKFTPETVLPS